MIVRLWHGRTKLSDGDDPDKAKYYPEDERYLLEKEEHSQNYQMFFNQ